jgi:hypothetical protein
VQKAKRTTGDRAKGVNSLGKAVASCMHVQLAKILDKQARMCKIGSTRLDSFWTKSLCAKVTSLFISVKQSNRL